MWEVKRRATRAKKSTCKGPRHYAQLVLMGLTGASKGMPIVCTTSLHLVSIARGAVEGVVPWLYLVWLMLGMRCAEVGVLGPLSRM